MTKVLYLERNTRGRDFVCGDLHGSLPLLHRMLRGVAFNTSVDRLFAAGDLIDRGEQSLNTLQMLRLPWFFSVVGNHELMLQATVGEPRNANWWYDNGGEWAKSLKEQQLQDASALISERMPLIVVVGRHTNNRWHVCHAQLHRKETVTDAVVDAQVFSEKFVESCTWGRTQHPNYTGSPTYVGHTVVKKVRKHCNHVYLDTGAYSHNGCLSMIDTTNKKPYTLPQRRRK